MRKLLIALVVAVAGALIYATFFAATPKAPEIVVSTLDGRQISLNRPGKPILVNFWATSCPGCIAEMPHLAEMKRRLGDRFDILAIAMSYDPLDQVKKFIAAKRYPFLFAHDTDGKLAEAFGGVSLTPTSFLIAPNGNIVYFKIGEVEYSRVETLIRRMSPFAESARRLEAQDER